MLTSDFVLAQLKEDMEGKEADLERLKDHLMIALKAVEMYIENRDKIEKFIKGNKQTRLRVVK